MRFALEIVYIAATVHVGEVMNVKKSVWMQTSWFLIMVTFLMLGSIQFQMQIRLLAYTPGSNEITFCRYN